MRIYTVESIYEREQGVLDLATDDPEQAVDFFHGLVDNDSETLGTIITAWEAGEPVLSLSYYGEGVYKW